MDDSLEEIIPFGLLELDATGTVLFYEPVKERNHGLKSSDLVGRNFFTHLAPLAQVREFQGRFRRFMTEGEATQRCTISVPFPDGPVQIQILLAHITSQAPLGLKRMAIVQIKPKMAQSASQKPLYQHAHAGRN